MGKSILIIFISLFIIPSFEGCNFLGNDLSKYMTEEEKEYRDRANTLPENLMKDILESAGDPEAVETPEELCRFLDEFCKQIQSKPRELISSLKNENPPALFLEYHKMQISVWENFIVFTPRMVRAIKRAEKKAIAVSSNPNAENFQMKYNKISSDLQAELASCEKLIEIEVLTHNTAFEKIESDIKNTLCSRGKINPSNASSVFHKTDFSLSFQPDFIPVKISINQNGEVSLSCQESLPTPIGVFSIEHNVRFTKSHTLTVIYNTKKYIYSLDNKPFTFDVADFKGSVKITFTETGNLTIILKS